MILAPENVRTMARYNGWQNRQMKDALQGLGEAALVEERGAFFGSIMRTINHLLWGDWLWMSRFDGGEGPPVEASGHDSLTPNLSEWAIERFKMDARILHWADTRHSVDLTGDLTWYSGMAGQEMAKPLALCVTHFFNHQTHHRGQIHAMATAAGAQGWTSDLIFMPEEGPWV
ncbi:damage-inducible protein DinB [Rhodobacteraceae bacterium D3-12]|nr:damage-inducible protein DinB [Rhodobacteraceae bacterium D3-12]